MLDASSCVDEAAVGHVAVVVTSQLKLRMPRNRLGRFHSSFDVEKWAFESRQPLTRRWRGNWAAIMTIFGEFWARQKDTSPS